MRAALLAVLFGTGVAVGASRQDPSSLLATVGTTVDAFYARARSIVARETVTLQPLHPDLRPRGLARVIEYDVRIDWTPPSATITRDLLRRTGHVSGSEADPECLDPKPSAYEPLAPLQTARQPELLFRIAGSERESRRNITILEYRPRAPERASITWNGRCGTIAIEGATVGRVWVDSATGEVRRVDERLVRRVPFVLPIEYVRSAAAPRISQTLDRHDVSTRYEAIVFRDPEERITLPVSITATTVIDNGAVPHLLTTHRFSNYRRFITSGRVVK